MTSDPFCLVGDIGGTNARFAVADLSDVRPRLIQPIGLLCAQFDTAADAIAAYFRQSGLDRPPAAVMAVAGPVEAGAVQSTNGLWALSQTDLKAEGFAQALVMNDYTALAWAAPILQSDDLAVIGVPCPPQPAQTLAVLGAGTGFGVGALARSNGVPAPVVTEGGHIAFAPTDEIEIDILRLLAARHGRVSVERILSGPGLADLHWAMARIAGQAAAPLDASEVVAQAAEGDPLCGATVERFCDIYGSVAGDIALTLGARGGVYIAGGIAPRILGALQGGGFRRRFEAKGRFQAYMAQIPTQVILHPYAALLGAAAAFAA